MLCNLPDGSLWAADVWAKLSVTHVSSMISWWWMIANLSFHCHWDYLPLNSPFIVRVTHFSGCQMTHFVAASQRLCTIFKPISSFSFLLPSGSEGHRWALTVLLRVSWDLSDPAEALKTSQRAAVSPTVWPAPPPPPSHPPPHHHHNQCKSCSQTARLSKSSFTPLCTVWDSERNMVIYWPSVPF